MHTLIFKNEVISLGIYPKLYYCIIAFMCRCMHGSRKFFSETKIFFFCSFFLFFLLVSLRGEGGSTLNADLVAL